LIELKNLRTDLIKPSAVDRTSTSDQSLRFEHSLDRLQRSKELDFELDWPNFEQYAIA